jgi:chromosomal replication initiation ATPase DnaA
MVSRLEDYPWSSYLAFINRASSPNWLVRDEIYGQMTHLPNKAEHYRLFMEDIALNEVLIHFYDNQRLAPVLGDELFVNSLSLVAKSAETPRKDSVVKRPSLTKIITETASAFGLSAEQVLRYQKGRGHQNIPRKIAMYLGQKIGDYRLNEIASVFGLQHYGGVASAIYSIVEAQKLDKGLCQTINGIINRLDP